MVDRGRLVVGQLVLALRLAVGVGGQPTDGRWQVADGDLSVVVVSSTEPEGGTGGDPHVLADAVSPNSGDSECQHPSRIAGR